MIIHEPLDSPIPHFEVFSSLDALRPIGLGRLIFGGRGLQISKVKAQQPLSPSEKTDEFLDRFIVYTSAVDKRRDSSKQGAGVSGKKVRTQSTLGIASSHPNRIENPED